MPSKYISPWAAADAQARRSRDWSVGKPIQEADQQKQRLLVGEVVDEKTYQKYNRMTWDLGDGINRSIYGLKTWAESSGLETEYSEMVAKARNLYAKILAEITGKGVEKMSDTRRTAGDFLKELQSIYTETRTTYAGIQDKVEKAQKRMEQAQEKARGGDQIAQMRYAVAKDDLRQAENEAGAEYRKMMGVYGQRVDELRETFAGYLNEHYAANPDKMDSNTMALLNSGICTADELANLVERHNNCPTMVRIIGSFADKMIQADKDMPAEKRAVLNAVRQHAAAAQNGNREMEIFDSAVATASYGLGKDYNHATRMDTHIGGWFDDLADRMNNLPIVPDTMAPAASAD